METGPVRSLGFLDSKTGALKSKEDLEPIPSKKEVSASESAEDSSDTSVRSAVKGARVRSNEQVNSFVNILNQDIENLKSAKSNVKASRSVARDLKQAIKAGDTDKADELKKEFQAIQAERDSLASKIDVDNRRQSPNRVQGIRVGNETRATFRSEDVEFSKSSEVDLDSVDGINAFLDSSKEELEGIRGQIQTERQTRGEVRDLSRSIRKELNSIASSSEQRVGKELSSFEEAASLASNVALQIGAQETVETSIVSSVDRQVAESLLSDL